jgi:hypothetical protein
MSEPDHKATPEQTERARQEAERVAALNRVYPLLRDADWRLSNLYKIVDKDGNVVTFKPWPEQQKLFASIWYRNIILKARQRGFSTAIQLLGLDMCLWTPHFNAAVIAHDLESASKIFRKVRRAYDSLPKEIRDQIPLVKCTETELIFANVSSFSVTTSARSTTLQFLHLSEFGKMCARYPDKAEEVIAGTLPAVAPNGWIFIESTAEGQEGAYYEMVQTARANFQMQKKLDKREYRYHFASWWDAEEYQTDPSGVVISVKEHDYFDDIEHQLGRDIGPARRAWYIATRDNDFGGDAQLMKQEYSSIAEEAFEQSVEGVYLADQLMAARRDGRITDVRHDPRVPVNTFWDIGVNDDTVIWFHQRINGFDHWINFFEASGQPFSFFVQHMQTLGYTWGKHYLPHDGDARSPGAEQILTARDMLERLGLRNIEIVPRTPNLGVGIRQLKDAFPRYRFDKTRCKPGLIHLDHYRKSWNKRMGAWADEPVKNGHQHAADAIRQHAQAFQEPAQSSRRLRRTRYPSAMAV